MNRQELYFVSQVVHLRKELRQTEADRYNMHTGAETEQACESRAALLEN